jgi:citrate lyase subunit beta/citryl-CoA lyase
VLLYSMIFNNLKTLPNNRGEGEKRPYTATQRRSNMMLNPLNLKHLNRIDESPADMITLNLEDAIAPSRKQEALENIQFFLSHLQKNHSQIIVRINALDEGGLEELKRLYDTPIDAIRIPKIKNATQIAQALAHLPKDRELHISLETKEAFENLRSLRIDERLTTANLGILDLLNSLGLPQSLITLDNPTIEYILSKFLIDAHTAGIHPISFMFQAYEDTDTFEAWCHKEKKMGFTSKACMGPKQTLIANEIFGISNEAQTRARYIKEQFELHQAQAIHGFMDPKYGLFIDEPIYRDALLTLQHYGS